MQKPDRALLSETYDDLTEDIGELSYLIDDAAAKLMRYRRDLSHSRRHLSAAAVETADAFLRQADRHVETDRRLCAELNDGLNTRFSTETARQMINRKYRLYDRHRILRGLLGGLITATEWQSPTYAASIHSQAGIRTGAIKVSMSDYTRDNHRLTMNYEQRFKAAYIDGLFKIPVVIYATNSGMAAFTTILEFLTMEARISGTVLIGSSTYFEAKALLRSYYGTSAVEVDDRDAQAVAAAIRTYHPAAIFLDTVGNTPDMTLPDLPRIAKAVRTLAGTDTYVILDNTCLSAGFQPLSLFRRPMSRVRLIVYESLNKFHQFGTDTHTGGIVWASGRGTEKLFDYRGHLGTIISTTTAASLPDPDRTRFRTRQLRLGRNNERVATYLANRLQDRHARTVNTIVYPSLPDHPSSAYARTLPFAGAFFMIGMRPRYRTAAVLTRTANKLIRTAGRRRIPLVAGTSFGFPVTRIYPTALRSDVTNPFLRIAVGTETALELHAIGSLLEDALFRPF